MLATRQTRSISAYHCVIVIVPVNSRVVVNVLVSVNGSVAVTVGNGVAVTILGIPVVTTIAVSRTCIKTRVASFCAVGVLVTTNGVGVLVANSIFLGVGVTVPVVVAFTVAWLTSVAATKTSTGS